MEDIFEARCLLLQQNRQAAKRAWFWAGSLIQLCCANVYTLRDRQIDAEALQRCQAACQRAGERLFQPARKRRMRAGRADGPVRPSGADAVRDPGRLRRAPAALPCLGLSAAGRALHERAVLPRPLRGAYRAARDLYDRMRQTHPILTASEDAPLCVLLALSDKNVDLLLEDVEACYQQLKPAFPLCGNPVQTLSLVLALMPGSSEEKTRRVMALFDALKRQGRKWGTTHELSVLGILALQERDPEALAADILTCDRLLAQQKGFGPFSISGRQRLMYAGLMAQPCLTCPSRAA